MHDAKRGTTHDQKPAGETWLLLDSRGAGGIESHVAELAIGLAEAGEPVRVLLMADHGPHPLRERLARHGVPCETLHGSLRAQLRARRPRLLHTHGYKANLMGRIAARIAGVPVVASFHAGERPPGRVGLYDLADRWTAVLGPRIAVSRPIQARLPWGATLVPNFVGMPSQAAPVAPPDTVAFVGRLSPEKGPDLFCAVAKAAPGPRYEVFGDGPLRVATEEQAGADIRFHGARPGMSGAWAGIGLLLITSRAEGLPLAALEAMAHGVPVAAFGVGGLPDLITHGQDGYLAPPEDIEALAACVRHWHALPVAARAALGQAARARVATEYGREAGIARIRAVYASAAA